MSEIPGDLKFMKSHEWARVEGDGKVTVGISDHAQGLLGDLVYVELATASRRAMPVRWWSRSRLPRTCMRRSAAP